MPVYYPSMVAHLFLRFDEALLAPKVPVKITSLPSSGGRVEVEIGKGRIVPAPQSSADKNPSVTTQTTERPDIYAGKSDNLTWVKDIIPKQASVELLSPRQASKWSMTLDFRDLPLDPRCLRAIGCEIHLGTVSAENFAEGIAAAPSAGKVRASMLDTRTVGGLTNLDTLLLVGDADSHYVEHTDTGSWVHLEGRDLRGILLDSPLDPKALAKVDLTKQIGHVVTQIVSLHPFGANFKVKTAPDREWPDGEPPIPGTQGNLTRVNLGALGNKPQNGAGGDPSKFTFWDAITQYCYLVGAVPYFKGYKLLVRPARSLYTVQRGQDIPFAGGVARSMLTDKGPTDRTHRLMVYGRNVSNLKLERKLHGKKVPSIQCVCVDTSGQLRGLKGKLRIASYPPDPKTDTDGGPGGKATTEIEDAQTTDVAPSGKSSNKDVLTIPVRGFKSEKALRQIAQGIREEIGHGELTLAISTKDLASFGGTNADTDLLRLRPGEAVEIAVDTTSLQSVPPYSSDETTRAARSQAEEIAEVAKRVGSDKLAAVIVETRRSAVLQTNFQVSNVKYTWDVDKVAVDFDAHNYVEARYDVASEDTLPGETQGLEIGRGKITERSGLEVGRGKITECTSGVTLTVGKPTILSAGSSS